MNSHKAKSRREFFIVGETNDVRMYYKCVDNFERNCFCPDHESWIGAAHCGLFVSVKQITEHGLSYRATVQSLEEGSLRNPGQWFPVEEQGCGLRGVCSVLPCASALPCPWGSFWGSLSGHGRAEKTFLVSVGKGESPLPALQYQYQKSLTSISTSNINQ